MACESIRGTHAGSRGFVVEALRPGVNRKQSNRTRPPFKFKISRVVAGISIPLTVQEAKGGRDIAERFSDRHGAITQRGIAARYRVACGGIYWRQWLADIDPVQQVCPFVAHVICFQCRVSGQFALH